MATLKPVILNNQENVKGESNIKIVIIHKRKTAYIRTNYYVKPSQMLPSGKVDKKHPNYQHINAALSLEQSNYERKILKLGDAINNLSASQIKEYLTKQSLEQTDFFAFADKYINELEASGKRTFKIYRDSITQIEKHVDRKFLPFNEITVSFLEGFVKKSIAAERSVNTISVYLRSMRTVFLRAMDELNRDGFEPVILSNPFQKFKIKSEQTKKRNISIDVIRKIRDYETDDKKLIVARDMFMLTFYLIGINVIDLFYAKGVEAGRINYIRMKTKTKNNRAYSVKVEPEAQAIIDKYKGEKYLLIFSDNNSAERKAGDAQQSQKKWQYSNEKHFGVMINDNLDTICKNLKIADKITTYWARHSWATIAWNECEIPESTISVCLGHDETSNQTTQIYIEKRLRIVDQTNRKVLDELLKPTSAPGAEGA